MPPSPPPSAAVLANVGFSALLAAEMGILKRLSEGMQRGRMPAQAFVVIFILIIVGLILSIVGGVDVYSASATNPVSPSSYNYIKDGAIRKHTFLLPCLS